MTFLAAFVCLALAAALCWILFTFAVFALPFFAGLAVGSWAHTSGTGWPMSFIAGVGAAVLTYIAAMTLGAPGRPVWLQWLVGVVFAVPAIFLGFQATRAIAGSLPLSDASQLVIGGIGAMVIGAMAFFKIIDPGAAGKKPTPPEPTEP